MFINGILTNELHGAASYQHTALVNLSYLADYWAGGWGNFQRPALLASVSIAIQLLIFVHFATPPILNNLAFVMMYFSL